MSTHTWHADATLLEAYVNGAVDALEGASVEQHLLVCVECRTRMSTVVDLGDLSRGWDRVQTAIERTEQPAAIRVARRLGLSEPSSVLLAASASLRTAWLSATLVALGFALLATNLSRGNALWPFLLVAPLIPVIGVAVSYGPKTDSLEALIATSPYGRTRLILVRTLGVLVVTIPLALLIGLMLPGPTWVAAAWLGPALSMLPILLALASFIGPRPAASVLAMAWSLVVLGATRRLPATWAVEPDQQLVYLALAAVAGAVLLVRSRLTRKIGATL